MAFFQKGEDIKFIIVLAGIHNILREQTQERIDDGFIGMKTKGNTAFSHTNRRSGVGKIDFTPKKKPLPFNESGLNIYTNS